MFIGLAQRLSTNHRQIKEAGHASAAWSWDMGTSAHIRRCEGLTLT